MNLLTAGGFERAQEFMLDAVRIDPECGRAHAGLAEAYLMRLYWGYLPPEHAIPLAEASAATADRLQGVTAETAVAPEASASGPRSSSPHP